MEWSHDGVSWIRGYVNKEGKGEVGGGGGGAGFINLMIVVHRHRSKPVNIRHGEIYVLFEVVLILEGRDILRACANVYSIKVQGYTVVLTSDIGSGQH